MSGQHYEGIHSYSHEKSVVLQPKGHQNIVNVSCTESEIILKCSPSHSMLKEASIQTEKAQNICLSCQQSRATIDELKS